MFGSSISLRILWHISAADAHTMKWAVQYHITLADYRCCFGTDEERGRTVSSHKVTGQECTQSG